MSLLNVNNMTSTYPKSFGFQVRRMRGYNQTGIILYPQNLTSAIPTQQITFNFPTNTLINMSKNVLQFQFTSTASAVGGNATFAVAPKNIECLFRNVEWMINGQVVDSFLGFNQWYNWYADFQLNSPEVKPRRAIMSNAIDQAAPTANQTNINYAVQQWGAGFGGSLQPQHIFTGLFGQLSLRITLDSPAVLIKSNAAATASYTLSNIFFTTSAVNIDDGHFFNAIQSFFNDGGSYIYTWQCWWYQQAQTSAWTSTTLINRASMSLNRVLFWFTDSGANSTIDTSTAQNNLFSRLGNGVDEWYVSLNGKQYPEYRVKHNDSVGFQTFTYLMNELNMAQDRVTGIDPIITGPLFLTNFTCFLHNFACEDTDGENFLSGKMTAGANMPILLITTGASGVAAPTNPLIVQTFIETTSQLIVKAGQQFDLVQ